MAVLLLVICVVTGLIGIVVATFAWRGRRIDDHRLCRRCGFDLYGSPETRLSCPECGTSLEKHRAIRIGNRRQHKSLSVIAAMIAGFCVVLLGFYGYAKFSQTNFNPYKPVWLLRFEATTPGMSSGGALRELVNRAQTAQLTATQMNTLVDDALTLQADPAIPWNPYWGELFIAMYQNGIGTPQQHEQFSRKTMNVTWQVRSPVREGDPIQFAIQTNAARPWMFIPALRVSRETATLRIGDQSNDFQIARQGEMLVVNGAGQRSASVPFPDLSPGQYVITLVQPIEAHLLGSPGGPVLAAYELTLEHPIEILPADAEDIHMIDEPALGNEIEQEAP